MKLKYLDTAESGLRWMRRYYREQPQLDAGKAVAALQRAEAILQEFPFSGTAYEGRESVREYRLQGSVFSLLYTVASDTIWIIDLHDQRGYRSAEALRHFQQDLRKRMRGAK